MNNFSVRMVRNLHKLLFCLFLMTFFVCALPAKLAAQSDTEIGKKAYGQKPKPKKRAAAPAATPTAKSALPKRKSAVAATSSVAVAARPPVSSQRTARKPDSRNPQIMRKTGKNSAANADLVDATFVTSSGKSEIWLNDKLIGITDNNAYLTKKLKLGEYTVNVKKNNKEVNKPTIINVSAEQKKFLLFGEAIARSRQGENSAEIDETPSQANIDKALKEAAEATGKAREILRRYGDPETTDSVTLKDWEFVFEVCRLGELQGYTRPQIEAQSFFALGQIEYGKGNYLNAYKAFDNASKILTDSALPFYALGNAYLAIKQTDDAYKAFQQAIKLKPDLAMAYRKIADILAVSGRLNDTKQAVGYYEKAILYKYATAETRENLALTFVKLKRWESAAEQFEAAGKLDPKAQTFISLGDSQAALKKNVSAIEAYQKATELDPDSAIAHSKLGEMLYRMHESDKARTILERALQLDAEGKLINVVQIRKMLNDVAREKNDKERR